VSDVHSTRNSFCFVGKREYELSYVETRLVCKYPQSTVINFSCDQS